MEIILSVGLFVLGAMMGSFACCQVWRMRNRDKSRRSHCMDCKEVLRWYDMVPVVSWLMLRGRCRKCGTKIGVTELLSEVVMGVVFMGAYWWWPEWSSLMVMTFGVFLALLVGLAILFMYDLRWKELPTKVLVFCVVVAAVFWGLNIWIASATGSFTMMDIASLAGALVILPGLYFVLYKASRERWMGGGDWWVALACALVLADWWLALCCVCIANVLGSVVGLVQMRRLKKNRKMRLAFGPFLIIGMLVVFFAQGLLLGLI